MTPSVVFKVLDRSEPKEFELFYKIYSESIEKSEQKPKQQILEMCGRQDYLVRNLYSRGMMVGFTLSFLNTEKKFALLEYMAVDPSIRSQGFGSELLKDLTDYLRSRDFQWLVLEVDSPYQKAKDQSARVKRVAFYEKNGCREVDGLNYILPLPTAPSDLEMKLLLFEIGKASSDASAAVESKFLRDVVQEIYVSVYKCLPTDNRINTMFQNSPETFKLRKMRVENV